MKRLLKLMFGDWAEIKLVLFVAIILGTDIHIYTGNPSVPGGISF